MNQDCENTHCTQPQGEVRLLPYGGGGNMILCKACYEYEIRYRKSRIKEGLPFKLPKWNTLRVYEGC